MIPKGQREGNYFENSGKFIAYFLILLLFIAIYLQPMLLNSADYRRVLRGLFDFPVLTDLPQCVEFTSGVRLPSSSMGLFFMLTAAVHKALGVDCFYNKSLSYVLYTVSALGSVLAIRHAKDNILRVVAVNVLAIIFSFIVSSYYEEAALIAVIPWFIYGLSKLRREGKYFIFVGAAVLLTCAKAQMIFFIPFVVYLLWTSNGWHAEHKRKIVLSLCAIILATMAANALRTNFVVPNAYNRLYNGIGWSTQNVSTWPANSFKERRDYFEKNHKNLQGLSAGYELFPAEPLLGTSFWPTGNAIFSDTTSPEQAERVRYEIGLTQYLRTLMHFSVATDWLKSTYLVYLQSDYSIAPLQGTPGSELQAYVEQLRFHLLKYFGYIYCLAVLLIFAVRYKASKESLIFMPYFLLLPPLAVVFGDGFFEFEKHTCVYMLCSPLLLLLERKKPQQKISR